MFYNYYFCNAMTLPGSIYKYTPPMMRTVISKPCLEKSAIIQKCQVLIQATVGELFWPLKVVYNHNHPSKEVCMYSKGREIWLLKVGERRRIRRKEKRKGSICVVVQLVASAWLCQSCVRAMSGDPKCTTLFLVHKDPRRALRLWRSSYSQLSRNGLPTLKNGRQTIETYPHVLYA